MGWKYEIYNKSLLLHRKIGKLFGYKLYIGNEENILTRRMGYDCLGVGCQEKYEKYNDYCRYRCLELIAQKIRELYNEDGIAQYAVAEAGVFQGDFAWMINELFPTNNLYLYDTFSGFDKGDVDEELNKGYTSVKYMKDVSEYFEPKMNVNNAINVVMEKMPYPQKVIFRPGYFPDTVREEESMSYIFVSLDMDLYKPVLEGLKFFWPRMAEGGYIFIHDYNNKEFHGVKDAISEYEKLFGYKLPVVPLPDQGGTCVIQKI